MDLVVLIERLPLVCRVGRNAASIWIEGFAAITGNE
jgi:hypothetical protein